MPLFEPTPDHSLDWTTSEQVHPTMTLDGDPIYYKYIETGAMPNNAEKTTAHGITGLNLLLESWAVMTHAPTSQQRMLGYGTSTTSLTWYFVDDTNITTGANADWSSSTTRVYMMYTKD